MISLKFLHGWKLQKLEQITQGFTTLQVNNSNLNLFYNGFNITVRAVLGCVFKAMLKSCECTLVCFPLACSQEVI